MSAILSESDSENLLRLELALLKKLAEEQLKKAADALECEAPTLVRGLLLLVLDGLGHKAEKLSQRAAEKDSEVGREVAKEAQALAGELYQMARKLKDSLGKVQLEQATQAAESSEAELLAATYAEEAELVKSGIEEVECLIKELAKLKGHEVEGKA